MLTDHRYAAASGMVIRVTYGTAASDSAAEPLQHHLRGRPTGGVFTVLVLPLVSAVYERQSTASARAVQWGDNNTTTKGARWLVVCPFEKRFETRDATCSLAVTGTNAATKGPIDATVPVYMRTRVAFSLSAVDMAGGPAVANGTVAFFHGHGGQFIARGQLADGAAAQPASQLRHHRQRYNCAGRAARSWRAFRCAAPRLTRRRWSTRRMRY